MTKKLFLPRAALIDMDGVLYDSMPRHADAWMQLMKEAGLDVPRESFFRMEGMTGAATIRKIYSDAQLEIPSDSEIKRLYARKSELFREYGSRKVMPGAKLLLDFFRQHNVITVLVTGSGQQSLLSSIDEDFPCSFHSEHRVTANDVINGKPSPEPYLRGLEKAGTSIDDTIVIENAPLGIKSGVAAGCFTIGVTTGPLKAMELYDAGANVVFPDMNALADAFQSII